MARILLSPPAVARPVTVRPSQTGVVELAAVWLFCLAMTLGPVFLLLASSG